ncbi:hypothetical protein BH24CHL9_BH24CHL9_05950 [soil metagenome]
MSPIIEAASELQSFCVGKGWRFCFIGGLAVQRWGEPRLTQDADLALITGFGSEGTFVDALMARFGGRRPDARDFALRFRVVLSRAANGTPLDISLGAMPYEERAVERSSEFAMAPGASIRTCSAEDLVVLKAFANREQDWLDIDGIVRRQWDRLDTDLIWQELEPLLELKESREEADRLRGVLDRVGGNEA